jgi:NAD(P)H-dependent FMN reductase
MITVIAGTNRPGSNTLKIANLVLGVLHDGNEEAILLDLAELPAEIFGGSGYAEKPPGFARFQEVVLATQGVLTVVPEYNGSFPGVLKYFIDMLQFPESLYEKPAAFIGLSSGPWGGLRAVEQLEMIFQYRHAHLFGRRVFLPRISTVLDGEGNLSDPEIERRLQDTVAGFAQFCRRLMA